MTCFRGGAAAPFDHLYDIFWEGLGGRGVAGRGAPRAGVGGKGTGLCAPKARISYPKTKQKRAILAFTKSENRLFGTPQQNCPKRRFDSPI